MVRPSSTRTVKSRAHHVAMYQPSTGVWYYCQVTCASENKAIRESYDKLRRYASNQKIPTIVPVNEIRQHTYVFSGTESGAMLQNLSTMKNYRMQVIR